MTRLIAFSDAHFGSGESYSAVPGDRLVDQEQALNRLVDLALELNIDGVLFGGDAFEGPAVPPEQYEAFRRPLRRLREAGIRVVGINGNARHDCAMRSVNALQIISDVMDVYREPGLVEIAGVYVALLPWASVSWLAARFDGGDRDDLNASAGELVRRIARGLFTEIPEGAPSILLGHWSVSGSHLPNGTLVDELREPVIYTPELEAIGYDLHVFGHIHVPGFVDDSEKTLYTGPLLPCNFGEAGQCGAWLIDLDGGSVVTQFIPIPSRSFVTLDIPPEDAAGLASGLFTWDGVEDAIVRVRYTATEEQARRIDHSAITAALIDAGAHKVFILPEIVRADRARVTGVDEDLAPLAALQMWVEANEVRQGSLLAELTRGYLDEVAA